MSDTESDSDLSTTDDEQDIGIIEPQYITRKQGVLWKKAKNLKRWERVTITLSGNILIYSKKRNRTSSPINLLDALISRAGSDKYGKQHCFEIGSSTMHRLYVFAAESFAEMVTWVDALTSASITPSTTSHGLMMRGGPHSRRGSKLDDGEDQKEEDDRRVMHAYRSKLRLSDTFHEHINPKVSSWRTPLALSGIQGCEEHSRSNRKLKTSDLSADDYVNDASAFCLHQESDRGAIGSFDGDIQFFNWSLVSELHGMNRIRASSTGGISSLCWQKENLLAGSTDGVIKLFNTNLESTSQVTKEPSFEYASPIPTSIPPPDSSAWPHSTRINRLEIHPVTNDCFLTLENLSFHVFDLSRKKPVVSEAASTLPLFAGTWNPFCASEFLIGGGSRNIKLLDSRFLTTNPGKAVVWKVQDSHADVVRDVSWNKVMEHWVATCSDDGFIHVWDLRYGAKPMRVLEDHGNPVTSVAWSHAHAEMLVSGSLDRTLKLWNLRNQPHYVVNTQDDFKGGIIGCSFSHTKESPMRFFGCSTAGECKCVDMTEDFAEGLVQHRYPEEAVDERKIESALYFRQYEDAFKLVADLAGNYWDEEDYDKAKQILALVSHSGFTHATSKAPNSFTKLIKDLAYFMPKSAKFDLEKKTDFKSEHEHRLYPLTRIEILKRRLDLKKRLEKPDKFELVLKMEDAICDLLKLDDRAFSIDLLRETILTVLERDYLPGVNMGFRFGNIMKQKGRFNEFFPIARLLLYPTIYDSELNWKVGEKIPEIDNFGTGSGSTPHTRKPSEVHVGSIQHAHSAMGRSSPISTPRLPRTSSFGTHGAMMPRQRSVPFSSLAEATTPRVSGADASGVDLREGGEASGAGAELGMTALQKQARARLDRDLKNPKNVLDQLALLYKIADASEQSPDESAAHIIGLMRGEGSKRALAVRCHREYHAALLHEGDYGQFFSVVATLRKQIEGQPFSFELRERMENEGMERLKRFVDECLPLNEERPWDISALSTGLIQVMSIVLTSPDLPPEVESTMQQFVNELTNQILVALEEMLTNDDFAKTLPPSVGKDSEAQKMAHALISQYSKLKQDSEVQSKFMQDDPFPIFTRRMNEFINLLNTNSGSASTGGTGLLRTQTNRFGRPTASSNVLTRVRTKTGI